MDCYAIEFPIQIAELRRILGFPINIKTSHLHDKEAYPSPVMDGVLLLLLLLLLLPCKCELPRDGGRGDGNPTTVLQGACLWPCHGDIVQSRNIIIRKFFIGVFISVSIIN